MSKKLDKKYEKAEFVLTNNSGTPQNLQLFNMNQLTFPTTPTFTDSSWLSAIPVIALAGNLVVNDTRDEFYYAYSDGFNSFVTVFSQVTHLPVVTYPITAGNFGLVLDEPAGILYTFGGGIVLDVINLNTGVIVNNIILNHAIVSIDSVVIIGSSLYMNVTQVGSFILVLNKGSLVETAYFACVSGAGINNSMKFDGTRYIYYTSQALISLGRIDVLTNTSASILTGAIVPSNDSSVGIVGQYVYFANFATNTLVRFDTLSLVFLNIPMSVLNQHIHSFDFDATNNLLYITSVVGAFLNAYVSVLDTTTNLWVHNFLFMNTNKTTAGFSRKFNTLYKNSLSGGSTFFDTLYAPSIAVTGSVDYEYFVRSIWNEPKRVRRIEINANTVAQVGSPIQIMIKDANGNNILFTRLPNTTISVMQFNQVQANVDFKKELILSDGTYINSYILGAGQTVSLILYYKAMKLLELYGMSANLFPIAKENMVSEEELRKEDSGRGAIFPATYLMSNPDVNNLVFDFDLKK